MFAAIAAFTPGPNNIMIMSSGLNHGIRASLPHFLGICLGFPSMILAVGLGLGYVFNRYPILHIALQVVGVVYLLYLSWLIASSEPNRLEQNNTPPLTFIQAALFQWINPKAWIMGTSALAAYTTVGDRSIVQTLIVVAVFLLMAFPSAGVWLIFGNGLKKLLSQPFHQRCFNVAMGLLLVLSIMPIILELGSALMMANLGS